MGLPFMMSTIVFDITSVNSEIKIVNSGDSDKTLAAIFTEMQGKIESTHLQVTVLSNDPPGSGNPKLTKKYILRKGYRKELLFLSELRVLYGRLYVDVDAKTPIGWVQIGYVDDDDSNGKLFGEFQVPVSFDQSGNVTKKYAYSVMPYEGDIARTDADNVIELVQEVIVDAVPNFYSGPRLKPTAEPSLTIVQWFFKEIRLKLRRLWQMVENGANQYVFLKVLFRLMNFFGYLWRLLTGAGAGCKWTVAGFDGCSWSGSIPKWQEIFHGSTFSYDPGKGVTVTIGYTKEVEKYGVGFVQRLVDAALSDFPLSLQNSGAPPIHLKLSTPLVATSANQGLNSGEVLKELHCGNRFPVLMSKHRKVAGNIVVVLGDYSDGLASCDSAIVGFRAIGFGLLIHEIGHHFGVEHGNGYVSTIESLPWATLMKQLNVSSQRINMWSTKSVLYEDELGVSACANDDGLKEIAFSKGIVQRFPDG